MSSQPPWLLQSPPSTRSFPGDPDFVSPPSTWEGGNVAGASACNHPLVARPSLGLSTGPVLAPHGRFQNRLTEERFRLQSGSTGGRKRF